MNGNEVNPQSPTPPTNDPTKPAQSPLHPDQIYPEPNPERKPGAGLSESPQAVNSSKSDKPDGMYFLAGLMLIPPFIMLQLLYVSPQIVTSLISASVTQTESSSVIDNLLWILLWATVVALGLGAVLLLVSRSKLALIITTVSLLMTSACMIRPIWNSIESYSAYQETKNQYSTLYGDSAMDEITGLSSRLLQIAIVNQIILFALPIVAMQYLRKPHVKQAYS